MRAPLAQLTNPNVGAQEISPVAQPTSIETGMNAPRSPLIRLCQVDRSKRSLTGLIWPKAGCASTA
jgi:hypothetical protein